MNFSVISLFPDAFKSYFGESILKRAIEDGKINVRFFNPRDFTKDKHKRIDRVPYGGGPGMVIQAEPVLKAVGSALRESIKKPQTTNYKLKTKLIWLTPSGKQFDTKLAKTMAKNNGHIIFICGRYEGIDARVKQAVKNSLSLKIEEVSVGPYVLTGGELPAMMMIDSISRQVPGILGDIDSLEENRIASPDVYTRPEVFVWKGKKYAVPKVLLSGHHKKIEEWKTKRLKKPEKTRKN